jgi:hypothetical protein
MIDSVVGLAIGAVITGLLAMVAQMAQLGKLHDGLDPEAQALITRVATLRNGQPATDALKASQLATVQQWLNSLP